jgi:hypothetical protein
MAIEIEGDQTAVTKLFSMDFKHTEQGSANDLRCGTVNPKLNHAGKTRAAQCQKPGEIQILTQNDGTMGIGVVKDDIVWISSIPDVSPMGRGDPEWGQEIMPARRQIFVDDQLHDARSSYVSAAETSAAKSRAARMESGVR